METLALSEPRGANPYDIEKMNKELINGSRSRPEEYSMFDPYDLSKNISSSKETKVISGEDDTE